MKNTEHWRVLMIDLMMKARDLRGYINILKSGLTPEQAITILEAECASIVKQVEELKKQIEAQEGSEK